jgi:tetratricopeptide (TPR) repeat protein
MFVCGFLFLFVLTGMPAMTRAADTNAVTASDTDSKSLETITSQDSLRSYLQIQEQLHNTQATIEKNRVEASNAAAANTEILDGRLNQIEKTMAAKHLSELQEINRILIASGIFATFGLLVLLAVALLQLTAINRLATATLRMPANSALPALSLNDRELLPPSVMEQTTARFLSVMERLEQRMADLESAVNPTRHLPANGTNGDSVNDLAPDEDKTPSLFATGHSSPVALLLGKGQSLLKLDQPESALDCFDQALALDPANTEVLIKKGAALERLQRLSDAIECYNRAIAHDNTLTMAYLYKGAVFNRMERYGEALECYEQALKTRQKIHAANVIFE